MDDDSRDDDSGSDIQSGPPRKRRRPMPSHTGMHTTPASGQLSIFEISSAHPSRIASHQHTPSARSPSDSESDIDAYGGSRRALAAKKHQRRLLQPTRDITPAHGEVRFSTRKAAKVSNYNEDDDDMFDDEADTLPQSWAAGMEENVPAIDVVLNHRLREGTSKLFYSLHCKASD